MANKTPPKETLTPGAGISDATWEKAVEHKRAAILSVTVNRCFDEATEALQVVLLAANLTKAQRNKIFRALGRKRQQVDAEVKAPNAYELYEALAESKEASI